MQSFHAGHTHAIKNIGRKVLNLNDITYNKRLGNLISRCFEMPYVSYCHPLATIIKMTVTYKTKDNKLVLGLTILVLLTSNYIASIFIPQYMTDVTAYNSIGFWLVILNFTLMTLIVLGYKK